MAIQNKLVDMKLQIRVEDTSTGEMKVKNLNFTRIKCAATNDELYAAANAIAALQSRPLSGIRTVATGDLADAGWHCDDKNTPRFPLTEGAGCFYFAWKRLLKLIFYSCHKVSAQVVETGGRRRDDVMSVKKVVNVQEEARIIVRLIGEIDIREELGFHRCIGRRITRSVAKVADMERRGQLTTCIVDPGVEAQFAVVIVPFPFGFHTVLIDFAFLLLWVAVCQSKTIGKIFILISGPVDFDPCILDVAVFVGDIWPVLGISINGVFDLIRIERCTVCILTDGLDRKSVV